MLASVHRESDALLRYMEILREMFLGKLVKFLSETGGDTTTERFRETQLKRLTSWIERPSVRGSRSVVHFFALRLESVSKSNDRALIFDRAFTVLRADDRNPSFAQVALLAIEWRQRFGMDVVIDMYCYRRYGHNEGDEPRYTQPRMYAVIDKKPTVRQMYVKRLVEMGEVTEPQADEILVRRRQALTAELDEVKQRGFAPVTYAMAGVWSSYRGGRDSASAAASAAASRADA